MVAGSRVKKCGFTTGTSETQGDAFLLTVVFHEGGFLLRRLGPGQIAGRLLLEAQPSVDILGKESAQHYSGGKCHTSWMRTISYPCWTASMISGVHHVQVKRRSASL